MGRIGKDMGIDTFRRMRDDGIVMNREEDIYFNKNKKMKFSIHTFGLLMLF